MTERKVNRNDEAGLPYYGYAGSGRPFDQIPELVGEQKVPDLWWSASWGVLRKHANDQFEALGGRDFRGWFPSTHWPDDAVRLAAAPPAPRVFLPGDIVPAESAVMDSDGRVRWSPDDWATDGTVLDVDVPSLEEWLAAVDRARTERGEA